jgi:hypothetical protein
MTHDIANAPVAPTASSTTTPAPDAGAVLCPRCGYDLRATTAERCSECGLAVDRAALAESGFPWAHRGRLGRARAFAKTLWQVTVDDRRLRHEMAKPQDPRDARRFGWAVAALAAAGMLAYGGFLFVVSEGRAIEVSPSLFGSGSVGSGLAQDALVPWAAAVAFRAVLPLCLAGLAGYLATAPAATFRLGRLPPGHQAKARAVAAYAAAPLAWLAVAGGLTWAVYGLTEAGAYRPRSPLYAPLVAVGTFVPLTVLLAFVGTLRRTGQWRARAGHGGAWAALFGAAELLVRWGVGAVVFLWFFPWCAGYVWLVVDSYR